MYYKIIRDGVVVDVQNELDYVTQSPITQGIIGSDTEAGSMGIVSSDGSEIWHLDSLPKFLSGEFQTVSAVRIEKDEYDILLAELSAGREISEELPSQNDGENQKELTLIAFLRNKIQDLASAEADNDAIVIDHEYRLTMLELGLTDI